jgi:hypothetical protein
VIVTPTILAVLAVVPRQAAAEQKSGKFVFDSYVTWRFIKTLDMGDVGSAQIAAWRQPGWNGLPLRLRLIDDQVFVGGTAGIKAAIAQPATSTDATIHFISALLCSAYAAQAGAG